MDACRARALHKAGLRTPLAVLQADEHMLKEALAEALPRGMQRQMGPSVKGGTLAAAQVPICPAFCLSLQIILVKACSGVLYV